jgi:type I restriction enzyme, S subunit
MNSTWQEVELQEIADFQNGYAFKGDEYVPRSSNGKEVLRMGYIQRGGGFKEDGKPVYAPLSSRGNDRRYELDKGDIVIAMTDMKDRVAILGNCARIPSSNRFLLNQRVGKIRSKNNKVANQRFLYYYMNSPSQVHQLRSMANRGVQVNLTTASIIESLVFLPPIQHQEEIAHILGTLDDKIELNRKTNETLEAMAKALFKSWFVDFDPVRAKAEGRPTGFPAEISDLFPDSFEDSEMGEIPSGWVIGRLEEILEIDPQRQLRRGSISPYLEMKGVPTSGHSAVEVIAREFSSGSKFRNGDTLLARITPCLENGKTAFVDFLKDGETGWGSTEFIVMCGRQQEVNPFAYYLARSEAFRNNAIQNMVGSSGRQRVPSDAVSGFTLPLPPEEILGKFGLLATDLMRRISANADQSLILSKIRDALLQKLISGEIRIPVDENLRRLGYVAS